MGEFKISRILEAGLYTMDGEKVLDLSNLEEFEPYDEICYDNCMKTYDFHTEMRGTLVRDKLPGHCKQKWKRIVYGWTAKGPVRQKGIKRAYELMHIFED